MRRRAPVQGTIRIASVSRRYTPRVESWNNFTFDYGGLLAALRMRPKKGERLAVYESVTLGLDLKGAINATMQCWKGAGLVPGGTAGGAGKAQT